MSMPMTHSNTCKFAEPGEDLAAKRERLILEHLPQVRWIAMRLHERLPHSTSLEDLISIGTVGLINAVDNFDPSHNAKLKTYAEHKIRGAILDSVRGSDGVPTHKRKHIREVQRAMEILEQRLQTAPSEEQIAEELGISVAIYREWLLDLRGITMGSLDAAASPDDSRSLMYFIAEPDDQSPARLLEKSELERVIEQGVKNMPRMEGLVLDLYYKQELNTREIASILKIHITRVSQIKSQAVLRLRSQLEAQWPSAKGGRA
jgi:RNA polymerase sigma factor FliA